MTDECPSIQDAREALDGQWNRHIGGLSGRAREITSAINDLISARLADRDRNTAMLLSGKSWGTTGIGDMYAKAADSRVADLENRLRGIREWLIGVKDAEWNVPGLDAVLESIERAVPRGSS